MKGDGWLLHLVAAGWHDIGASILARRRLIHQVRGRRAAGAALYTAQCQRGSESLARCTHTAIWSLASSGSYKPGLEHSRTHFARRGPRYGPGHTLRSWWPAHATEELMARVRMSARDPTNAPLTTTSRKAGEPSMYSSVGIWGSGAPVPEPPCCMERRLDEICSGGGGSWQR
jgi:hypothetical protein